jgi:hypothetical protein
MPTPPDVAVVVWHVVNGDDERFFMWASLFGIM